MSQDERQFTIFKICTAYEGGFGHGYANDAQTNPFPPDSDEWHGYDIGFAEGRKRIAARWTDAATGFEAKGDQ